MELKTTMQKRMAYQPTGLVMREDGEQHVISGLAIVCNAETVLYENNEYREIEVVDPACIKKEFIDTQDIKLNLLHERKLSIARNNKGKGTLVLEPREDGLSFEVPAEDCDLFKQTIALIKNGTYTGCSFEFWPKDYEVTERVGADGKTEYVIRHTAFEKIGAVTVGMDPAYEQTSVKAREMYEEQHPELQQQETEEEKENREADEAAERAEEERKLRQRAIEQKAREIEMMKL